MISSTQQYISQFHIYVDGGGRCTSVSGEIKERVVIKRLGATSRDIEAKEREKASK